MAAECTVCLLITLVLLFAVNCEVPRAKFEYKLSFKGPHLIQKDKSVPFWTYGGDAFPSDESVRVTPSLRSKKGWIWTKNLINSENWQIEVTIRVTGRGRVGADGMAIWFTSEPGVEGPVFGNKDMWNGLGIFLDSFDNDGQQNNPHVMAIVNDGTKQYDHQNDGFTQQIGGCLRDFRNKPYPVKLKVEYYKRALTVYYHNGMTQNQNEYELCLRAIDVILPKMGHFGVSAATGGLADDHDVFSFLTHSLQEPSSVGTQAVPDDERLKFEKEFEDYYKELEKAKTEFKKQHPEKAGQDEFDDTFEDYFESQNERELKMIFDGQGAIHMTMKDLNRKLDELLGRQELVLSRVSAGSPGQIQGQPQQGQVPPPMIDTIKRHEVNQVMANQNDLLNQIRDVRTLVNDIQTRTANFQAGGAGNQGNQMANQMTFHEIKDTLQGVKNDVSHILNRPQPQGGNCPPPVCPNVSCLSPVIFFITIGAQLIFMLGYMVYRQNKEAQAKKFF